MKQEEDWDKQKLFQDRQSGLAEAPRWKRVCCAVPSGKPECNWSRGLEPGDERPLGPSQEAQAGGKGSTDGVEKTDDVSALGKWAGECGSGLGSGWETGMRI